MILFEKFILRYRANNYKNKYDKGGIAYLTSVIKEGQTIIDVGAHKAGYTYWMLKKLKKTGRIFSIEPQQILYQYIKKLKHLLNWENVTVENIAFSDREGTAKLYIPVSKKGKVSSPEATIFENKGLQSNCFIEEVKTETLDSFCSRNNIKPDFLKIDVEGNELKVLQGGIHILKTCRPKIMMEIESRHTGQERAAETLKFMETMGYSGHFICGPERIPIALFSFDKHQNINDMKMYCNNFTFEYNDVR